MKRHHHLLLAAIIAVALGGCAVLVQLGPSEDGAYAAYDSLTAFDGLFGDEP